MKRKKADLYSWLAAAAFVTGVGVAHANPQSLQYPTSHTEIALQGIPVDVPSSRRGQVKTDADQNEAPPPRQDHQNPTITQPTPPPADQNVQNAPTQETPPAEPPPPQKKKPDLVPGGTTATPPPNVPPPGGTAGNATPSSNGFPERQTPEHSPTPPGFPNGMPTGSYAPAGPSPSGPSSGFQSYPQN
jgi:hypothetical protein